MQKSIDDLFSEQIVLTRLGKLRIFGSGILPVSQLIWSVWPDFHYFEPKHPASNHGRSIPKQFQESAARRCNTCHPCNARIPCYKASQEWIDEMGDCRSKLLACQPMQMPSAFVLISTNSIQITTSRPLAGSVY